MGLGDIDGDGFVEIGAAAPLENGGAGVVRIFRGTPTGIESNPSYSIPSPDPLRSSWGLGLSRLGDVDGDGFGDLAVSISNGVNQTYYLYRGGAAGPLMSSAAEIPPIEGTGVVTLAGDIDGDGRDDLLVANPNASPRGRVLAYLGSRGTTGSPIPLNWSNLTAQAGFGIILASGFDMDGDGFSDIVVASGTTGADQLFVFQGSRTFAGTQSSNFQLPATARFVAPTADLNNDGYSDLILGQVDTSAGRILRITAVPGSDTGILAIPTVSATVDLGSASLTNLNLQDIGDIDADGRDDVAVGVDGLQGGRGGIVGLSLVGGAVLEVRWRIDGDAATNYLGVSVAY